MRFAYRDYRPFGTHPEAPPLHLPYIGIRLIGLSRDALVLAKLDTGADSCLLGEELIERLDVHIAQGDEGILHGAAGRFRVFHGTIDFELGRARKPPLRWHARVDFGGRESGAPILLGHAGFLQYFRASFNGPRKWLTLAPDGPFPPRGMPLD